MENKYNPGSEEAIKAGCNCPRMDNCNGKGYMGMDGIFVYNENCQYHVKEMKNGLKEIENEKSKLPTIEDLKHYQQALQEKFGFSESIAYPNVSMSQLSVAKYYGGCKVNGQYYTYNPADDSLIRNDVIKFYIKLNKNKQTNDKEQTLVDLR